MLLAGIHAAINVNADVEKIEPDKQVRQIFLNRFGPPALVRLRLHLAIVPVSCSFLAWESPRERSRALGDRPGRLGGSLGRGRREL
jgi:hypothetical protein